jgi:hypothetical protein
MRRERRTSGRMIAKSISIKGAERKSGGCAQKAVELTSGDLDRVPQGLREPQGSLTTIEKSAEGVVRNAQSVRSIGTLTRKGRNSEGSHDRQRRSGRPERSPEGVNGSGK